jgi:hypothetical protein
VGNFSLALIPTCMHTRPGLHAGEATICLYCLLRHFKGCTKTWSLFNQQALSWPLFNQQALAWPLFNQQALSWPLSAVRPLGSEESVFELIIGQDGLE